MQAASEQEFITVPEFAAKYRIAVPTVRGHIHFGRLLKTKVGGRVLISREAEIAFVNASKSRKAADTDKAVA